jgi:hypothetical protein
MNDFISLLDVVIWPATVFGLSLLFRRELRQLFDRLSKFKYKDFEATFERELRQAELRAEQAALPMPRELTALPPIKPESEVLDRLEQLVEVHPKVAIVEAWLQVERVLLEVAEKRDVKIRDRGALLDTLKQLRERGIIDQAMYDIIDALRYLRNQAVHALDFSLAPDEARRYVKLASGVIASLSRSICSGST